MFKHLLIPTDGSDLSNVAVVHGVRFAKEIGAKITGLTVTPPYHYMAVEGMQIADTRERYDSDIQAVAKTHLAALKKAAEQAGVPCALLHTSSDHPYEEIVTAAQDNNCDVIFLASHGRRGIRAVVMGSETTKVLTNTKIPVVVYR
jgi:nucleotide-binding universal stress UspA family protein